MDYRVESEKLEYSRRLGAALVFVCTFLGLIMAAIRDLPLWVVFWVFALVFTSSVARDSEKLRHLVRSEVP